MKVQKHQFVDAMVDGFKTRGCVVTLHNKRPNAVEPLVTLALMPRNTQEKDLVFTVQVPLSKLMEPEYPKEALYAVFSERNDHEGETWYFYIPFEGNEAAITSLENMLACSPSKELKKYFLKKGMIAESVVDVLCARESKTHYMDGNNKLKGLLELSSLAAIVDADTWDILDDKLYKGGIRDLMRTP